MNQPPAANGEGPDGHEPVALIKSTSAVGSMTLLSRISGLAREIVFEGGVDQAYRTMFATPISPRLAEFSPEKAEEFRSLFYAAAEDRTRDGVTSGRLVSLLLTGNK